MELETTKHEAYLDEVNEMKSRVLIGSKTYMVNMIGPGDFECMLMFILFFILYFLVS